MKIVERTKKKLIEELEKKNIIVRCHYSEEELRNLVSDWNISPTYKTNIPQPGWSGKAKYMLQVKTELIIIIL